MKSAACIKRSRTSRTTISLEGRLFIIMVVLNFVLPLSVAAGVESGSVSSDIGSVGKKEAFRAVAVELLAVGIAEYNKSMFDMAYDSLLKAQNYKSYLTDVEQSRLSKYLKAAKDSAVERREAVEHIKSADRLVRAGQFIRAKAHLEAVDGSKLLTKEEKRLVKSGLKKIAGWLAEEKKQIKQIYNRSVFLYDSGQLENARAGFIKVAKSGLLALPDGKTAEDYIHKIDASIGESDVSFTPTDITLFESESKAGGGEWSDVGGILNRKDETNINQSFFSAGTKTANLAWLAEASKKKSVAQGYTRAVVKDTIVKAKDYIKNSNFYLAQKSIYTARKVLNENRPFLDESTFSEYDSSLTKLEDEVAAARKKWLGPLSGDDLLQQ